MDCRKPDIAISSEIYDLKKYAYMEYLFPRNGDLVNACIFTQVMLSTLELETRTTFTLMLYMLCVYV